MLSDLGGLPSDLPEGQSDWTDWSEPPENLGNTTPSTLQLQMIRIFLLLLVQLAWAWQDGAGTLCSTDSPQASVAEMQASKHGVGPSTPLGYGIDVQSEGGTVTVIVNGPRSFRGLLVYVVDSRGKKVGVFNAEEEGIALGPKVGCDGPIGSIWEHKSSALKSTPLQLSWTTSQVPRGSNVTIHAMVVASARQYETLKPVTIILGQTYVPKYVPVASDTFVSFMSFSSVALLPIVWTLLLAGALGGFMTHGRMRQMDIANWNKIVRKE